MSSIIIKVLFIASVALNTFSIPVVYPESANNNNNNEEQLNKRNGIELNIGLDLNDIPAFDLSANTDLDPVFNLTANTDTEIMNNESSSSPSSSLSISNKIETSAKTIPGTGSTKTVPSVIIDSNDQSQMESAKTLPNVIIDTNGPQEADSTVNVKTYTISISPPSPTPDQTDSIPVDDEKFEEEEEEDISAENALNFESSDYEEDIFGAEIEHKCEQNDEDCNDHLLNSSDVEFSNDEIDTSNVQLTTDTDSNVEVADAAPFADTVPEISDEEEEFINAALVNDVDSADEQENIEEVELGLLHDENSSNTPSTPSPSSPIEVNLPSDIPGLPSIGTPSAPQVPSAPQAPTVPTVPSTPSAPSAPTIPTTPSTKELPESMIKGNSTSEEKIDGINIDIDVPLLNGLGIEVPGFGGETKKPEENVTTKENELNEEIKKPEENVTKENELNEEIKKPEENVTKENELNEDSGFTVPKTNNESLNEGPIEAPDHKNSSDLTQSEYEDYLNDVNDNIKNLLSYESSEDTNL